MLPELCLTRLDRYTRRLNRTEPDAQVGRIRYRLECDHGSATLVEALVPTTRFPTGGRRPIARFRYTATRSTWTLYHPDGTRRWRRYELASPTPHITELIDEVDEDRGGIFHAEDLIALLD